MDGEKGWILPYQKRRFFFFFLAFFFLFRFYIKTYILRLTALIDPKKKKRSQKQLRIVAITLETNHPG